MQRKTTTCQKSRPDEHKPSTLTPAVPATVVRMGDSAALRKARVRKRFNDMQARHEAKTSYEKWQMERYGNFLPDGEPPLENYTD